MDAPAVRPLWARLYPHQRESVAWVLAAFAEAARCCARAGGRPDRAPQFARFQARRGLLLGHAPGLGKTPIAAVALAALLAGGQARYAAVVVPKTLLEQWRQHLAVWCPNATVFVYAGPHRDQELRALAGSRAGVLLTTYRTAEMHADAIEGVLLDAQRAFHEKEAAAAPELPDAPLSPSSSDGQLAELQKRYQGSPARPAPRAPPFRHVAVDILVLDEATEIKNEASRAHQALRRLSAFFRLALTGTPIMNNIKEMYNLIDFLHPLFLGPRRDFVREYDRPISIGRLRDATPTQRLYGQALQRELVRAIAPVFFRRTKEQVSAVAATKAELVLWMDMCPVQRAIFQGFVEGRQFRKRLRSNIHEKVVPFQLISCLRKVCENIMRLNGGDKALLDPSAEHRTLLERQQRRYLQACRAVGGEVVELLGDDEASEDDYGAECAQKREKLRRSFEEQYQNQGSASLGALLEQADDTATFDQMDRECSAKQHVMMQLLRHFVQRGLKTLIFTEHTTTLNLIQLELQSRGIQFLRIDGSVTSVQKRQEICAEFNRNSRVTCLIMTIKVGGFGLNLQGARRVIIFSPNWNPSIEEQAVGRAYRIGQTENVVVYKLLIRNSIEEKLVARQFHKLQVANQVTRDLNARVQVKYDDIYEMFNYKDAEYAALDRDARLRLLQQKRAELDALLTLPNGQVISADDAQDTYGDEKREAVARLQREVGQLSQESLEETLRMYYEPEQLEATEDHAFLQQLIAANQGLGISASLVQTTVGLDSQAEEPQDSDIENVDETLERFLRYETVCDEVTYKTYQVVPIETLRGGPQETATAKKRSTVPQSTVVDAELAAIFADGLDAPEQRLESAQQLRQDNTDDSVSFVTTSDSVETVEPAESTDDL